ncbi:MAG: hypothetical protein HQ580_18300, partial [Planctomycetes bacterium]|nr:hypothetical protein [Planctomycetota bacterium]
VCDFGIVYGLALQGLGMARIESNLLPRNIARSMAWASKGRYFIAAACMLLTVSLLCFGRTGLDKMNYGKGGPVRDKTSSILGTLEEANRKLDEEKRKGDEHAATIEKEFEPFKYREMIPSLYETIISALPDEKNNPKQARLYQAFARGDVKGITKIPRKDRKQIFITNMETYFSSDIATAQFGGADMFRKSRGAPGAGGEEYEGEYGYEMMMEMERMGGQYMYGSGMFGTAGQTGEEKLPGFVINIGGYSPYEKIAELMDPYGVEDNQDKWGLVTRLLHLDDFVDGNSPFEVYKKTDPNQFSLEIGEVNREVEMPVGIGVTDVRYKPMPPGSAQQEGAEWILVDPMTRETISKIAEWEENGRPKLDRRGEQFFTVNDHWFVLNVKFVWRDAPESVKAKAPEVPAYMRGAPMGRSAPPATTGSTGQQKLDE